MKQSYERWQPGPELTGPLESATLAAFANGSVVLLVIGVDGDPIKISFAHTQAVSAHDESTHLLMDESGADFRNSRHGVRIRCSS